MVYWITGRKDSGKTTLAYRLKAQIPGSIVLDGDDFREYFPTGFSYEEREDNIIRMAKVGAILEKQGHIIIVSCVSPYRDIRKKAQSFFTECIEICLPFGVLWEGSVYEEPSY
jgi:bifunctional enzyme CysN/CysC